MDFTRFAHPWTPDRGDGTYANPILFADYSDPDVVRDGEDFWMTASSFIDVPGLPILHSRDLVNWSLVNHALRTLPDPRGVYATPQHGCGVWAPAIRKHAGKFWIFFPMPDEGIYVTTAIDAGGVWSEPWCLVRGLGLIDPCPLWDDDGRAWLVHAFAKSRSGIKHKLRVCEISPDATRLLDDGVIVFDQPENHPTCEGPKFLKRDGWCYILAPAGGVATGWQLALRSRNVRGPYEAKVLLAQNSTPVNGPHQGALIDTPGGEWWFIHFQDAGVYGRIVHLQPASWRDGWPVLGVNHGADDVGEPTLVHRKPLLPSQPIATPPTSDEFVGRTLGRQWQWKSSTPHASATVGGGQLLLAAEVFSGPLGDTPNLLLQKFPAAAFSAETTLREIGAGVEAGLVIAGRAASGAIAFRDGRLLQIANQQQNDLGQTRPPLRLRVDVDVGGTCTFYVNGARVGELFQAVEGHWIGAKIGLLCRSATTRGSATFSAFRLDAPQVVGVSAR